MMAEIRFLELPQDYQLFPRKEDNSASVIVAGNVDDPNASVIRIDFYAETALIDSFILPLGMTMGPIDFSATFRINASLQEYSLSVYLD